MNLQNRKLNRSWYAEQLGGLFNTIPELKVIEWPGVSAWTLVYLTREPPWESPSGSRHFEGNF